MILPIHVGMGGQEESWCKMNQSEQQDIALLPRWAILGDLEGPKRGTKGQCQYNYVVLSVYGFPL